MRVEPSQVDWTVYLVTDAALCAGRGVEDTVHAAVRGGVRVVQIRDKTAPDDVIADVARSLLPHLRTAGGTLIINDRVDVAKAVQADGVHLGADDLSLEAARSLLGDRAIIGRSVDSVGEAVALAKSSVTYLAIGPVFATQTKSDLPSPGGLSLLSAVRAVCRRPLIAIGGINRSNAAQVFAAGIDGIAVVSAICGAADPEAEAQALRSLRLPLESSHGTCRAASDI